MPTRPGRLHDTQPPLQATLQQTLSAQKPEPQSSFVAQVAPFIFLPQLPLLHVCPPAHWVDCVQLPKHAPVSELHV